MFGFSLLVSRLVQGHQGLNSPYLLPPSADSIQSAFKFWAQLATVATPIAKLTGKQSKFISYYHPQHDLAKHIAAKFAKTEQVAEDDQQLSGSSESACDGESVAAVDWQRQASDPVTSLLRCQMAGAWLWSLRSLARRSKRASAWP